MGNKEKLLNKIKNNPTNVRFEIIERLLISAGFKVRQTGKGSSHYVFTYKDVRITIPKAKPINKFYVKEVVRLLENMD